jgi:hypothetical protein
MRISSVVDSTRKRVACGVALAGIMGGLTLMLEQLSNLPENPVLGIFQRILQRILIMMLLPGMIAAMAFSQNVHAWHLSVAAIANGLLYFGLGWLALRTIARRNRKQSDTDGPR